MRMRHVAGTLALVLLAGPALAQNPVANPSQTDRTPSPVPGGGQAQGIFVQAQKPGEWRGGKLVGVTIYTPDKQKLGNVTDFLVDDSGAITTVVIGVGGFLGIGEKNVAVPFSSVDWRETATSTTATGQGSSNTSGAPAGTGHGNEGRNSADDIVMKGGIPTHPVLNVSKADIQNAPSFSYAGRTETGGGTQPNTSSNRLEAPPAAPAAKK